MIKLSVNNPWKWFATCQGVYTSVLLSAKTPKGNWGIEIWSLGLFPTGSKTLAEVGRLFGCTGCI